MKVLFILGFYPEIGGPYTNVKNLLLKLVEKGVDVKVLSPLPKNYDKKKIEFIKKLPFPVEYIKEQLPRYIWPSFSLKFFKKINEEAKRYDLFHSAMIFDFYNLPLLLQKTPFICSPRGTFMQEAYKMKLFKRVKKDVFLKLSGKRILEKARFIHLITEEEKRHFLQFFPEFEDKIRVVSNGLILPEFEADLTKEDLLKKYPYLKDKKIILFLSRVNWKKGLDLLIPAFAQLHSEMKDVHLIIAGKDDGDSYENKVKEWVKKYNLNDSVTFTGLVTGKDKLILLYGSDIFVLPSYSENFGVAVVEAMACGLPVVISDKVGISNEIKANNAGLIVQTNIESIYEGMKKLLENGSLRKTISENGIRLVREYYNIEKVADKMIEMYEEALKK
ncbi:glycosyltransferase [Calditerrivibrio nitroreducens]|uniref:Glycosyl transferase group 1 n=1 Tax=Calditerrivibrio nitroreducens (strain DSM 19672 / NBRC 101217 / Yu37-1) TaxID=768670 RepID=E4THD6_CALNY|nr:glycosyltransferase [Calditerrivibrio nitroreducens]ADR19871.1 glycosyl transferase group 1 [Calditerrivibrio nitroreducens DSM 19672]